MKDEQGFYEDFDELFKIISEEVTRTAVTIEMRLSDRGPEVGLGQNWPALYVPICAYCLHIMSCSGKRDEDSMKQVMDDVMSMKRALDEHFLGQVEIFTKKMGDGLFAEPITIDELCRKVSKILKKDFGTVNECPKSEGGTNEKA